MQNRGNFVLNKARYLMNIDDADLCVYPKSISGEKKATSNPTPSPQIVEKKIPQGLFNDASWLGGIMPTNGNIK